MSYDARFHWLSDTIVIVYMNRQAVALMSQHKPQPSRTKNFPENFSGPAGQRIAYRTSYQAIRWITSYETTTGVSQRNTNTPFQEQYSIVAWNHLDNAIVHSDVTVF